MSTPVFKYKLPNVNIIDELYDAYVDGGEYGWYALVTTVAKYAWWNHTEQQWEITTYGEGDIPEPQCPTMPDSEEPVSCYVPEIPKEAEILYNIPVLKYLKDPAITLGELINRYTDGGEYGWYAFIFSDSTFAWWNHRLTTPAWELMTGSGGSAYGGLLTSEQDMDAALPGKLYAFTLSEEHSQLPAWNGALQVLNADEADGIIQIASVVVNGKVKQYARHGVVGNYSLFAENVPTFPDNTITSAALSQLPAGSNISGKNALEVLDLAINAELFPTLTAPSYTFTIEPSGLQEVGANVNIVKTRTFSRGSINPQYQSTSPYRSGTLIDYTETGVEGAYTVLVDGQNWTSKANYSEGPLIIGSKGTTAVIAGVVNPLPAGSTGVITRTITGVYPVYATTANISIYTKLGLLEHGADIEVNEMVAETAGAKQSIRIPKAWGTITSLQQFNTLSGQWDNIDLSTFTKTAVQLTINGSTVNYWEYTHNGATIGSRRLKFRL